MANRTKHNHSDDTDILAIWSNMLARCSQILRRQPDNSDEREKVLVAALKEVRVVLNASRTYYFYCFDDAELGACVGNLAMSCIPGLTEQIPEANRRVPFHSLPNAMRAAFEQQQPFGGPIVEIFADGPDWRDRFLAQKPPLLSVQLVPLFIDDVQWGFIGVDDVTTTRRWNEHEISLLDTVGELLGSALHRWETNQRLEEQVRARTIELQERNSQLQREIEQRHRAEVNLRQRLNVEQVLTQLSSRLLKHESLLGEWTDILGDLGRAVDARRMLLVHLNEFGHAIKEEAQQINDTPMLQWCRSGVSPLTSTKVFQFLANCPWMKDRTARRQPFRFSGEDDMPLDAIYSRFLQDAGATTVSMFPMFIDDSISILISIDGDYDERIDKTTGNPSALHLGSNLIQSKLRSEHILETLEQRLVERTREVAVFFDISVLASKDEPISELLLLATEHIVQIAQCESICVHLLSNDQQALTMIAQQGFSASECNQIADLSPFIDELLGLTKQQAFVAKIVDGTILPEPLALSTYRHYFGIRLHMRGTPIGFLSAYRADNIPFSIDNASLLTIMSELLSLLIENHRLYFEAQKSAIESERQRLARELHDAITQSLYSQTVFARAARYAVEDEDRTKLLDNLQQIESGSLTALREMRLLLFQLQPLVLREMSLVEAIRNRFQLVEDRLHIRTFVHFDRELPFDSDTRFEIYRIIMEALNNSLRHAHATQVSVKSQEAGEDFIISIGDDGTGFDINTVTPGLGLQNLRERTHKIHGNLTISSTPGMGTEILLQIPRFQ